MEEFAAAVLELVVVDLWKETPTNPEKPSKKWTLEMHQALAEWSLRVRLGGELPKLHKASGYEGPLLAVLKARHSEVGSKLQDMTPDKFDSAAYGYFSLPTPFVGVVGVTNMDIRIKVMSEDQAAEASDWRLVENTNKDAALVSQALGFSQDLVVLAKRCMQKEQFEGAFPDHDLTFEIKNAADRFPDPKNYGRTAAAPTSSILSSPASSSSSGVVKHAAGTGCEMVGDVIVTPLRGRRKLDGAVLATP